MRMFLISILWVLGLSALPAGAAEIYQHAHVFDMTSEASGRVYRIFVAEPEMDDGDAPYSIIYSLDANVQFGTMADTVRNIERRKFAKTLVVGIGYPEHLDRSKERAIDLTPSTTATAPEDSGGAELFLRFIRDELKPEIAKRYSIDGDKEALFGHSYGGLLTLYALINAPDLFDVYAAASPSLWFEDEMLLRASVRRRLAPKLEAKGLTPRVFISVGEFEQTPNPEFPVERPGYAERLSGMRMVDNAKDYHAFLKEIDGLGVRFHYFPGEDHGTVIPGAISKAATYILSPTQKAPAPAKPHHRTSVSPGGLEVPTADDYLTMGKDGRYALRQQVRALPKAEAEAWSNELKYALDIALTYGEHRALHEEKVAMDVLNGTTPKAH